MAIIRENTKYQISACATQGGITYYSIAPLGITDNVELLTSEELKILSIANLEIVDTDMQPIQFAGNTLIGNIPDISSQLEEDEWDDEESEYEEYEDYEDDEDEYEDTDYFEDDDDDSIDDDYADEVVDENEDDISYDEDDDYEDEYSEDYSDYEDGYDGYDDYEDYEEDDEESTVSRLYNYLTPEQTKVLKRYYLWYSQRIFTTAQKDPTLGMKDKNRLMKKKSDLNTLRNTGGLWHYAGFVDMGYKGAGYCTLGHPLRYLQLAWDVTTSDIETAFFGEDYDKDFEEVIESNNCIVFGIKCVGDFFEVDKDCVKALQKAQRDSLKDMALLCDYYDNGIVEEVKASFSELTKVMKKIKFIDASGMLIADDYDPILTADIISFYLQFEKEGMIPPKSLVQEIRDKIIGWVDHKFTGTIGTIDSRVFAPKFKSIYGKTSSKFAEEIATNSWGGDRLSRLMKSVLRVYWTYEICGWYKYNADTQKDEGGASKTVKYYLKELYQDSKFFKETELTFEFTEKLLSFYNKFYTHRIRSISLGVPEIAYDEVGRKYFSDSISTNSYFDIDWLDDFDRKNNTQFRDLINFVVREDGSDYRLYSIFRELRKCTLDDAMSLLTEKIADFEQLLPKYKEYVMERLTDKITKYNKVIDDTIEEEKRKRKEQELNQSSQVIETTVDPSQIVTDDDLENGVEPTDSQIIALLSKTDLTTISGFAFPKQVFDTVSKSGKTPSEKQMYYLKQLYYAITGGTMPTKKDVTRLSDNPELEEAIDWYIASDSSKVDDRTRSICKSIKRYGTISERQMKYALEARKIYEEENK